MSEIPVSIQLYSVREDMKTDLVGTLRKVAGIGYRNVELAGFGGVSAKEFKTMLTDCGLTALSAHLGFDSLTDETFDKTVEDYVTIGCKKLVVAHRGNQTYEAAADALNSVGARLKSAGFSFGYHNHSGEFEEKVGDKFALQYLIDSTSPEFASFELDTFWALYAGQDPVKFFERNVSRINMLHIKDMDSDGKSFAALGTGILPLDALIAAAERAPHVVDLIVEQDNAVGQTVLEAIAIAYKTLSGKGYL